MQSIYGNNSLMAPRGALNDCSRWAFEDIVSRTSAQGYVHFVLHNYQTDTIKTGHYSAINELVACVSHIIQNELPTLDN